MATKYAVTLDASGGGDFTTMDAITNIAGTGYLDGEWGATPFDDTVTITVRDDGGKYTEGILINAALEPTATYPLIIEAEVGDSPEFEPASGTYAFYCYGPLYVQVNGIIFDGQNTTYNIYVRNANMADFNDCIIVDATSSSIIYQLASGARFIDCRISGAGTMYISSYSEVLLQRCYIHLSYSYGINFTTSVYRGTFFMESCSVDCTDNSTRGLYLQDIRGGSVDIRNSTFFNDGSNIPAIEISDTGAGAALSRVKLYNNIFYDFGNAIDASGIPSWLVSGKCMEVEACDFYSCTNLVVDVNGSYANVAALQGAGYDEYGLCITSDPSLTTPFDGTLSSGASPCVETGIGAGVRYGLNGNVFNGGLERPSIGCDAQFDSESPVAAPTFTGISEAVDLGDGRIRIKWPEATGTGADHYELIIHTSDPTEAEQTSGVYTVGFEDDDGSATYERDVYCLSDNTLLSGGTTYHCAVKAWDDDGGFDTTDVVLTVVATTTMKVDGPHITLDVQDPVLVTPTAEGSAQTIYTCPAGVYVKGRVRATNTHNAQVDITIEKVPSGGSAAAAYRSIADQYPLAAAGAAAHQIPNGDFPDTMFELAPGDTIQAFASVADKVSVDLYDLKRVTIE